MTMTTTTTTIMGGTTTTMGVTTMGVMKRMQGMITAVLRRFGGGRPTWRHTSRSLGLHRARQRIGGFT